MIPKNLFLTNYNFNDPKLIKIINLIKLKNPDFKIYLFDDKKCKNFLHKNFDPIILYCFNKLKPGAYKADLFRLCILYILGGFYIDTYLLPIIGLNYLIDYNYVLVKDRWNTKAIFNSFMGFKKEHIFLKATIDKIINNVMNNYLGKNRFHITGPKMLYEFIPLLENNGLWLTFDNNGIIIKFKNETYILYLKNMLKIPHKKYIDFWINNDIYN